MKFFNVHTVQETFEVIDQYIQPYEKTTVLPLREINGHVLAEEVISPEDVPAFSRSTVDGYAVRAKDTYGSSQSLPSFLQITGKVDMGKAADTPLKEGEAQYIPTGGMLPPGADGVVMIEHVEEVGSLLNVYQQVAPGENVIRAGDDVKNGQVVMKPGRRLRPQDLGVLSAVGKTEVKVYERPVVGILSTGDEIVPADKRELSPGEVRDINGITISATCNGLGCRVVDGGIVGDDYEQFVKRTRELYEQVDFLILSGGSSVGNRDFTTQVMQSLGEPGILVHGVSVKPGKPTILAKAGDKPVLGLPGHPASAMIIFDLFGRRIINRLQGYQPAGIDSRIPARISRNIPSSAGRSDYIRVKMEYRDDEVWAVPVFGKSGLIRTLVESDGIVEIPEEKEGLLEGEFVKVRLFSYE
ncbi:MAG: molybdopterin molybdotransferase MoeA [Bacillaceae bacterium]|nr:molybdopterin molybdotransferase MoeA [Bacillaceae bacterium]